MQSASDSAQTQALAHVCPNPLTAMAVEPAASSAMPWHMLSVGLLTMLWYTFGFAQFGWTGAATSGVSGWTQAYLASCLWGGLAGSALLLLRSRLAAQAFVVSLVGLIATSLDLFVLAETQANLYAMPTLLGLWLITLVSVYYALRVHALGMLR